jgi:hypothetical protein
VGAEFGAYDDGFGDDLNDAVRMLDLADNDLQSWAYWQFKSFQDITTADTDANVRACLRERHSVPHSIFPLPLLSALLSLSPSVFLSRCLSSLTTLRPFISASPLRLQGVVKEGFYNETSGALYADKAAMLSRPFAPVVAGRYMAMNFNVTTRCVSAPALQCAAVVLVAVAVRVLCVRLCLCLCLCGMFAACVCG